MFLALVFPFFLFLVAGLELTRDSMPLDTSADWRERLQTRLYLWGAIAVTMPALLDQHPTYRCHQIFPPMSLMSIILALAPVQPLQFTTLHQMAMGMQGLTTPGYSRSITFPERRAALTALATSLSQASIHSRL